MNQRFLTLGILAGVAGMLCGNVSADEKVAIHGSVQADILFPEKDHAIGADDDYDSKILFNSYAGVNLASKYVDAGLRFEFMQWPMPGYDPNFKGWGFSNLYVKGKFKGTELTLGTFYEQFGAGLILRTYEERTLGIDNSILGARLKVNSINGLSITALGGIQRDYWDWHKEDQVYGANVEAFIENWSSTMREKGAGLTIGASWVMKHQQEDQDIYLSGANYGLKMPEYVNSFDVRSAFNKGPWAAQIEYAWKDEDPSFDNDYTYNHGQVVMLTGSYSKKGISGTLQAKRSANMSYRTLHDKQDKLPAFINYMPAFTYQHTYSLPAIYPYATQYGPGEWAFQGSFGYTFKRNTALGGKYGTSITLNASYVAGLVHEGDPKNPINGTVMGTDGYKSPFWKMGETNYWDFNLQFEKRLSRPVTLQVMYMNQRYNKNAVEGHGGTLYNNIIVGDVKWKMNRKFTLRGELQYMFSHQDDAEKAFMANSDEDQKDWAYGLVEFSWTPYLMIYASDMWNCGGSGNHYYMFGVTGTYRANRLQLSYGRTREGFNCSGGMCRRVPAMRGFQISYSYNF